MTLSITSFKSLKQIILFCLYQNKQISVSCRTGTFRNCWGAGGVYLFFFKQKKS